MNEVAQFVITVAFWSALAYGFYRAIVAAEGGVS